MIVFLALFLAATVRVLKSYRVRYILGQRTTQRAQKPNVTFSEGPLSPSARSFHKHHGCCSKAPFNVVRNHLNVVPCYVWQSYPSLTSGKKKSSGEKTIASTPLCVRNSMFFTGAKKSSWSTYIVRGNFAVILR